MSPDQEALVLGHTSIVESVVVPYRRARPLWGDDFAGAGYEGLCQAAKRWDPHGGASFKNWAWIRVRGAVCDEWRRLVGTTAMLTVSLEEATISEPADMRPGPDALACGVDVEEILGRLDPAQLPLARAILVEGLTLRQVADTRGVTESRVCQQMGAVRSSLRRLVAA